MQETHVIKTTSLTKHFGNVRALDGLDLTVDQGEIFGFLGPNGAGKSTAIRILLDLIRPTSGSVDVLGHRLGDAGPELRARIGYLPGELQMPPRSTAGRYLDYLARLRGGRGLDQVGELADRFALDLTRSIGKLSKGNKQKIGVVQAFMHDPELLILDEPTSGLDPLLQHEFQALIHERQHRGATVFMSSHVLSEIEDVAGRVGIIRSGRLVDIDDLQTLRHRAGQDIELRFARRVDLATFAAIDGVSEAELVVGTNDEESVLTCVLRGAPDDLLKAAANHRVLGWKAADRELEHLFLDFYRNEADADERAEPVSGVEHAGSADAIEEESVGHHV